MKYILWDTLSKIPITHLRFQVFFTQLLLAILLLSYKPMDPNLTLLITLKAIAGIFLVNGIGNLILFVKEHI